MGRSEFLGADRIHKIHVILNTATPNHDRYTLNQKTGEIQKHDKTENSSNFSALDDFKPPVKLHPGGLKMNNKLNVNVMHEGVLKQDEYNHFTFNKHGVVQLSEYVPILEPVVPIEATTTEQTTRFGYSIESMNSTHSVVDGIDVITNTAVPPVELVCVEHRDEKNHKINAVQHKINKNSLFEYLESKKAGQYDFNGELIVYVWYVWCVYGVCIVCVVCVVCVVCCVLVCKRTLYE